MEHTRSERIITIVILLSLLLHIILLIISTSDYSFVELLPTPIKKALTPEPDELIASMRPRMQSGAPVIFHEEPENPVIPTTEPVAQPIPAQEEKIEEKSLEEKKEPETKHQERQEPLEQAPTSLTIEKITPPATQETAKEIAKDKQLTSQPIPTLKKQQQTTQQHHIAPPTPPAARKLTLADISNDFMKKISQEAETTISIMGNDQKPIDASDMRQARYLEKIQECIKTSFTIMRSRAPRYRPPKTKMEVLMVLARRGGLDDLSLINSSGSNAVDQFFLHAIAEAGKTFPPMPAFFKKDSLPIHYLIYL